MNLAYVTTRLAANAVAIDRFVKHVDVAQARWKPAPEKWSMLEVICHLYDEERFDFRTRIDYTLHRDGETWPAIDPEGWVTAHAYGDQDIVEMHALFHGEREKSIAWLGDLGRPDWTRHYDHPQIGRLTAGDLLASWLAHDYLHVRQLARLHYGYLEQLATPYALDYAGKW
jgi:hypothetical protein